MKRKFMSVVLVLAMLFTFVPTAFADSTPLQVVTVTKIIGDHTNITSLAKGNKINLKVTMPSDTKANDVGSFDVRLWFDKTKLKVISAKIPKGIPVKDTSGNNAGDVSVTTNLVKEDNSSETTKLVVDVNAANTDGVLTANAISPDKKGGENTVGVSNGLQLLGAVVIDVTLEVTAEDGLSDSDKGLFTFFTFEIAKHKDGNEDDSASVTKEIVYSLSDIASAVDIWSNMKTVAYSGTPPSRPTAATNENGTVKLTAQTIEDEEVEYAVTEGSVTTAPTESSSWNTTGEFAGLEVGKEYTFWARVKASEKHKAGEAVSAKITVKKPALGGTVSISNSNTTHGTESPKIGDELTVNTASLTYIDTGTLSYQWYRSDNNSGFDLIDNGTGASYTLTTADLGKTIKVEVSNSKNEGTVSAVTTGAVSKKDGPEAPSTAPNLVSKTTSSIEVSYTKSNVEFACVKKDSSGATPEPTDWVAGTEKVGETSLTRYATFKNLEENTEYCIYVRFKATDDTNPSVKSTALSVTTKANATITINEPGTITYDGSAVVAAKSGESGADADLTYIYDGDGTVTVEWYDSTNSTKLSTVPTAAGTYFICVSAAEGENYAAAKQARSFTISKATPTASDFTITTLPAVTYDGEQKTVTAPTVKAGVSGMGTTVTVYYEGASGTSYEKSTEAPRDAGSYKVTFNVSEGTNYSSATDLEIGNLAIGKKAPTTADFSTSKDVTRTYNGQVQAVDAPTAPIDGKGNVTLYYKGMNGTDYEKSTAAPVNAGEYSVTFAVSEGVNYSATTSDLNLCKLTINKATMDESKTKDSMTVRDTAMKEYTYHLPELPEGASYATTGTVGNHKVTGELINSQSAPTVKGDPSSGYILTYKAYYSGGNGSADITVAVTGAKNYNDYSFVLTVAGQKKTDTNLSFNEVPSSKTYGDADFKVVVSKDSSKVGTWIWTSSDPTVLEIVGAGDDSKLVISESEASEVTVRVKKASSTGATIKVKYEDDEYMGEEETKITVLPKTLTKDDLQYSDSVTKEYDGNINAPSNFTVFVKPDSLVGNDTLAIFGTAAYNSAKVNEANKIRFTPTAIESGNYRLAASEVLEISDASIAPKNVTISGITADEREYVPGNTSVTLNTDNAVINDLISGDKVTVNVTAASIADANVGTDKPVTVTGMSLSGDDAANYKLSAMPSGITVNIIKADPTVTAPTAKTLIYNGSEQELINAGTTSGGTMKYRLGNTVEYSTAIPTAKDATVTDTYSVSWIVEGDSNYNGNNGGTITANISPKELTIYPASVSVTKGTEPVLELTYVGLVEGDTAGLSVTPKFELKDKDNKVVSLDKAKNTVGTYTITWSNKDSCSLTNLNYTIATDSQTGTLTVTANSSGGSGGGSYAKTHAVSASKVGNGSVSVDKESAKAGTTVTVIAKADAGYVLEKIEVKDAGGAAVTLTKTGDDTYTFIMPASDATLNAVFAVGSATFVDVPVGTLYYDPVEWAVARGITTGTDKTHFSPDRSCTRAEIVTFLWRAAGSPAVTATSAFTDVSANAYYAKAVAWATENGITNGTSATTFSPNATCTRAQGVAFLYRAQKSPAVSGSPVFTDVAANAYYANAVVWAVDSGVTNGIGDGLFGSDNDCTRAHIVAFLYRMMK